MMNKNRQVFLLILLAGFLFSCKKENNINTQDYPDDIGKIIITQCAVTGCHNDASKNAAGGLSLSTWEKMMEGSRNGAVTVPYSYQQSSMFLFTNTYSDLGVFVPPSMPFGRAPLSRDDVFALRLWINAGAPNKNDFVKFSDNPNRKNTTL